MVLMHAGGGGRFEEIGSYVRAKRVGPFVFVAGTTAIEPSGRLHAPGNTYAQTLYAIARIEQALKSVDADLCHVTRTRAFLADMGTAGEYVRAHGEMFAGIRPVATGVGADLAAPGVMVEIEVDALVHGANGEIAIRAGIHPHEHRRARSPNG